MQNLDFVTSMTARPEAVFGEGVDSRSLLNSPAAFAGFPLT
jgi:hypothetical protein